MPYFVDFSVNGGTVGITTIAQGMPAHQANDLLVAEITVDSGTATVTGSAWAALPSAPANPITQGTISYLLYFKAAGSSETLTLTTTDAYTCNVYCFRDVDGTTPFDGVTPKHAGVAGATTTPANESVTTATADAMVVFLVMQDGTTPTVLSDPGVMSLYNADSTGATATTSSHQSAAWYVQRAAAATPVANWKSNASAVYVRATFALRNASGGRVPAYIDDVSSPATCVTPAHHVATLNGISYSASGAYVITANVNSKTLTQATATNGADFGINPYSNALTSPSAQTAAGNLTGPELVITAAIDMSAGLLMGSLIAGTPKMGLFGVGSINEGGCVVRLGSAVNNWNAYQVSAKDSQVTPESRCVFAIQPGYNGSDYGSAGSSGDCLNTAVKYIQFLRNAPSFSSQTYASEIHYVKTQVVAGGDATTPVDADGLVAVGKSFRLPVIQKAGPTGCLSFAPIQIGGGDAVNFQIDAGSIQFPRRADTTRKDIQFHAADNAVGLSLAGKSGDTVKLTNSLVSSPTPFYFNIHANATNAATWDLTGTSIIGGNVTLRNVTTFNSMSFTSCPTLDFSSCTVTSAKISKVPAGNDTLSTNSSSNVDDGTIDVSAVTSGNRWCSVADPSIFTGDAFTGGGGHAIRITAAGTYTLTGNTFTGFGADGSNGAAIYNDSGGLVTINIAGGGSTPTVRNGAGASTTINNAVTVKVTAKDADTAAAVQSARVLLYASSGAAVTITRSGSTATVSHTAHGKATGAKVAISGANEGEYNGLKTITVTGANDYTFTISGTPTTPATGTVTSYRVILDGDSNASGIVQDAGFNYTADLAVTGRVRKGTAATYYKTSPLSGTITAAGLDLTAFLVKDT